MKKFITIAALLAAGTAAANAADVIWTLAGDDEVYTTGKKIRSDSEGLEFSLAMTFTLNELPSEETVIAQIQQWQSGNSWVYAKSTGIRLAENGGAGNEGYNYNSVSTGEKISVVFTWAYDSDGHPTITAYANGNQLYAVVCSTTATDLNLIVTQNDDLWTVHDVSAYTGILTADEISYLNDNKTSVVSSIPEPSAFGLLAGVGALALVAARRRRSK